MELDFAVYSELSEEEKTIVSGWNTRMFNYPEKQFGSRIQLDQSTGIISLESGIYHVTGCSSVTYDKLPDVPEGAGWPTKTTPNAGYCRLRDAHKQVKNENAEVVGTISNANMLPSFFDTYVEVKHKKELILEHQAGFDSHEGMPIEQKEHDENAPSVTENIYLQHNVLDSKWHIFARISIRRVAEISIEVLNH